MSTDKDPTIDPVPGMIRERSLDYDFRCPKCGSSHFGSGEVNGKLERECHDEFEVGCRARFTDDAKCFTIRRDESPIIPKRFSAAQPKLMNFIAKWGGMRVQEFSEDLIVVNDEIAECLKNEMIPVISRKVAAERGRFERILAEASICHYCNHVPIDDKGFCPRCGSHSDAEDQSTQAVTTVKSWIATRIRSGE